MSVKDTFSRSWEPVPDALFAAAAEGLDAAVVVAPEVFAEATTVVEVLGVAEDRAVEGVGETVPEEGPEEGPEEAMEDWAGEVSGSAKGRRMECATAGRGGSLTSTPA